MQGYFGEVHRRLYRTVRGGAGSLALDDRARTRFAWVRARRRAPRRGWSRVLEMLRRLQGFLAGANVVMQEKDKLARPREMIP